MYGAPGWVVHTVTNPWGFTAPGSTGWGIFVTAGIWISLQMWDHYTFTGDVEFLRNRAYPVLREAAEFFLAYIVPEPKHGWLVTGPSDSPENWHIAPSGGHIAEGMGNTCDRVFVYALFTMCMDASKTLNTDEHFGQSSKKRAPSCRPFRSAAMASCRSGSKTSRMRSRTTGILRPWSPSIPSTKSRRARRLSWPAPRR